MDAKKISTVFVVIVLCIFSAYFVYKSIKPNPVPVSLTAISAQAQQQAQQAAQVVVMQFYTITPAQISQHIQKMWPLLTSEGRRHMQQIWKNSMQSGAVFQQRNIMVKPMLLEGAKVIAAQRLGHKQELIIDLRVKVDYTSPTQFMTQRLKVRCWLRETQRGWLLQNMTSMPII